MIHFGFFFSTEDVEKSIQRSKNLNDEEKSESNEVSRK